MSNVYSDDELCICVQDEFSASNQQFEANYSDISSEEECEVATGSGSDISKNAIDRLVNLTTDGNLEVSINNSLDPVSSDLSMEEVSSESDADIPENKVRSVVKSLDDKPIFASDNVIKDLNESDITSITVEGGVSDVINSVKLYANKTERKLQRNIWLSVGNRLPLLEDVSVKDIKNKLKWSGIVKEKVENFKRLLQEFNSKVTDEGGKLFVLAILPSPYSLNQLKGANSTDLNCKLLLELNSQILTFNKINKVRSPCVNRYLLETIKKSRKNKGKRVIMKARKGLYTDDGKELLEPSRLVIMHVIKKIIRREEKV